MTLNCSGLTNNKSVKFKHTVNIMGVLMSIT